MKPRESAVLWALALAVLIHLDWHLARSGDAMSGHWSQHWLVAIPAFGALGLYLARKSARPWATGAAIIAGAAFLGQLLEPLSELATGASWSWAWGRPRWMAFAEFMAAGLATLLPVLAWRVRRARDAGRV